jgi:2-polyprenyl-3-methyl-5-hydroxy-6-metoxy-1,4-benzoquinol methylase
MPEVKMPKIDEKSILEVIKAEAAYRNAESNPDGDVCETTDVALNAQQVKLSRISGGKDLTKKEAYHLNDFLGFHDEDFIRNAYRCVLQREPDLSGFGHYLEKLRKANVSKVELLGRLRFSSEGRRSAIRINGLLRSFLFRLVCRVPIFGYSVKLFTDLLRLPTRLREIEEGQAFRLVKNRELEGYINDLTAQVERAITETREEAATITSELQAIVQDKVDSPELQSLREVLGAKVDILTVDAFNRSQQVKSDGEKLVALQVCVDSLKAQTIDYGDSEFANLYAAFEERFRGERQMIKDRMSCHLPRIVQTFDVCSHRPVLDIGCGRGELLELLKEKDVLARGVDANPTQVQLCRDLGLDVFCEDAFDYLQEQPEGSFSVVTAMHIVEHLPLPVLMRFLKEIKRVLCPQGLVVLETPNPSNVLVGSCNFYLDPTHLNPLPPQLMQFLLEEFGFCAVEIVPLNPAECQPVEGTDDLTQRFNQSFYGAMDYAVVGQR